MTAQPGSPVVAPFYHGDTQTIAYVVHDPVTRCAAIIDPVWDYDAPSARTATSFVGRLLAHVNEHQLKVAYVLETHAHADHLSAGAMLRDLLKAKLLIGRGITRVQHHFQPIFGQPLATDGSQFDQLLDDDDRLPLGALEIEVLATPGHTPDSLSYRIGDAVFVGDTLFAPDVGTARCDFPGGSAELLYRSIQRLLALPPETRLFLCHDYPPGGRALMTSTTIAATRDENIHLARAATASEFVAMRETRDATLPVPRLLLPALQVNLRGGRLPPPDADQVSYLRLPVNRL
jgi:glyoxylase-like metal-dependent hydrolase (beta-lactamase superfamily II)